MEFSESRRSLAKNLPRFLATELEPCDGVLEGAGDKSFQGLEAIRTCGLFGGETLSLASAWRHVGDANPEGTSEFSALHRACDMLRSSSRPDDATSTSQRGKL
jgi:hypothetical protein